MYKKEKVKEIVVTSLLADSYSLGAHWVYDEDQLKNLEVDWEKLNAPKAMWHKGKSSGDFTHIGDQAYWLYKFLQDKEIFNPSDYFTFWEKQMSSYQGYVDGATRETLENIKSGKLSGSNSHDFSVIGRTLSLLLVSKNEDDFIQNVQDFVKLSHDSPKVVEAATFFAKLLLRVNIDKSINDSMLELSASFSQYVQESVKEGIDSKERDTFSVIREFGPACDIDEGFRGIVHLLAKYPDNLKELLTQNAKAGGDNSSRAMIAAGIIVARNEVNDLPSNWYKINKSL